MHEFWEGLKVQWRVWGALFMREIQTRWGRRNLGFAWLFAEPLTFALPVLAMWSMLRSPYQHGLPLMPFLWSGYMAVLIFRHVSGHALYVIRSNGALLYHSAITPLDLVVARCGLEAMGNIAAVAFSFIILYEIGFLDLPENLGLMALGFLYTAWWSFAIAMIVAALSERSELIEHVWPTLSYMYLPVCGFFFLAEWLPDSLRPIALAIDPPLHTFEIIRAGLFGSKFHPYYDQGYLAYILSTLTLIGLWLMRNVRQHVEVL
ncbi:MAG: ABC transporter permease [Xanthobacteraceae bacterium]